MAEGVAIARGEIEIWERARRIFRVTVRIREREGERANS